MGKSLFIAEKPSVAKEFAKILKVNSAGRDGYIENDQYVITWCVGHLVNMSYPEKYDENLRRWSIATLPFLPSEYKYEVISSVEKQFEIVKGLLCREDVEKIYVCTDSGREGEYIYRLVDRMAEVGEKDKRRVWIDSQTEEEILRGIREAKPLSEYDSLADSAYLRAKEDYLIGINFSRLLTLLYGRAVSIVGKEEKVVIAIGRVMTCVLGMVVDREREIRNFKKTSFYKLNGSFDIGEECCVGEWRAAEGTKFFNSDLLYNDTGFKKKEDAEKLANELGTFQNGEIVELKKKQQKENAPLLFNLAELQNECSKRFKISPDETLSVVQSLYEKKLVTYPRTDARVLSTAIAKEISKNVNGLANRCVDEQVRIFAGNVLSRKYDLNLIKTKYVDDSKITDHYAIIPTGQGFENFSALKEIEKAIYQIICVRFLAVFYPPAVFNRVSMTVKVGDELFFANTKTCKEVGYLEIMKANKENGEAKETLGNLKKGQILKLEKIEVKEGETTPPSRYTTGTMILAMENAGKLIEDEELRAQIKGAGIGTSATRAEIIKKLQKNAYILCNSKTQVITPSVKGELIYEVVRDSMPDMLNPELTASWEKGLMMVANKEIGADVFMDKLENYIKRKVHNAVEKKPYINPPRIFKDVKVE